MIIRKLEDTGWFLAVLVIAGYLILPIMILRHPLLAVPVAAYIALCLLLGVHDAQAIYVWLIIILVAWRLLHKQSFQRVLAPIYNRLRRYWKYARHWRGAMMECGLDAKHLVRHRVPKLLKIERGPWHERVLIHLPRGQTIDDVRNASTAIAGSFGHTSATVSMDRKRGRDRPRHVWLRFTLGDPLANVISVLPFADSVDLKAVDTGIKESGGAWTVPVLGQHIFLAGATGRGKSGVLWAIIRGLAPAIKAGLVQLHVCDPKGGVEFGFGRAIYTQFARTKPEQMIEMLERAVVLMHERGDRMMGRTRLHEPTVDEPLHLIIIDELATLFSLLHDRNLRNRAYTAIGLLLTQGRAMGVCLFAAAQDPRVENIDVRLLFTVRIGLGFDEPGIEYVLFHTEYPHEIKKSTPGIAYVAVDGETDELERVRTAHVRNRDIYEIVEWITDRPYDPDYEMPDDEPDDEPDNEPDNEPDDKPPLKPSGLRIVKLDEIA